LHKRRIDLCETIDSFRFLHSSQTTVLFSVSKSIFFSRSTRVARYVHIHFTFVTFLPRFFTSALYFRLRFLFCFYVAVAAWEITKFSEISWISSRAVEWKLLHHHHVYFFLSLCFLSSRSNNVTIDRRKKDVWIAAQMRTINCFLIFYNHNQHNRREFFHKVCYSLSFQAASYCRRLICVMSWLWRCW
jgi:hypothetical protein